MVTCCVPYCKSRSGRSAGLTFHQFPRDPERREKWVKNISRKGEKPGTYWNPRDISVVCSKHFEKSCYNPHHTSRRILLWNAVPTIFPGYPPHKQRYSFDGNPVRYVLKQQESACDIEESDDGNIQNIFLEEKSCDTESILIIGESDEENVELTETDMYQLESTFHITVGDCKQNTKDIQRDVSVKETVDKNAGNIKTDTYNRVSTKERSDCENMPPVKKLKPACSTLYRNIEVLFPEIE